MVTEKERDVPANDGSSNMRSCRRMDIEYQLDQEHLSCIRGDAGFPWKPGKSNPCARCGFCSPHSAQEHGRRQCECACCLHCWIVPGNGYSICRGTSRRVKFEGSQEGAAGYGCCTFRLSPSWQTLRVSMRILPNAAMPAA